MSTYFNGQDCVISRFDSYFLLDFLHKNDIKPELIMRGAKILQLKLPDHGIRVVDSLSYLQMPLKVKIYEVIK